MKNKSVIFLTVGGVVILGILLWVVYSLTNTGVSSSVKIASYSQSDAQRPQAKTEKVLQDLGKMKVSDQKSADFVVKNTGKKPLQLSGITTSCGCTLAQVIYEGKESEQFGMHSQSNYVVEVLPQKEAIIRVTYKPFIMPVYGNVERETYVTTNDPAQAKLVFQVKAFVE